MHYFQLSISFQREHVKPYLESNFLVTERECRNHNGILRQIENEGQISYISHNRGWLKSPEDIDYSLTISYIDSVNTAHKQPKYSDTYAVIYERITFFQRKSIQFYHFLSSKNKSILIFLPLPSTSVWVAVGPSSFRSLIV